VDTANWPSQPSVDGPANSDPRKHRPAIHRLPTRAAAKQEKIYSPNFAEITECRQKKFRRNSASSALLGGKFVCFFAKIPLVIDYASFSDKLKTWTRTLAKNFETLTIDEVDNYLAAPKKLGKTPEATAMLAIA
jgi:hypothetical protein